jgi:hypothetical protein
MFGSYTNYHLLCPRFMHFGDAYMNILEVLAH